MLKSVLIGKFVAYFNHVIQKVLPWQHHKFACAIFKLIRSIPWLSIVRHLRWPSLFNQKAEVLIGESVFWHLEWWYVKKTKGIIICQYNMRYWRLHWDHVPAKVQGPQYPLRSVWHRPRACAPSRATISRSLNPMPFWGIRSRDKEWVLSCISISKKRNFLKILTHDKTHHEYAGWCSFEIPYQHRAIHILLVRFHHFLNQYDRDGMGSLDHW